MRTAAAAVALTHARGLGGVRDLRKELENTSLKYLSSRDQAFPAPPRPACPQSEGGRGSARVIRGG